jgi:hypothetical protein
MKKVLYALIAILGFANATMAQVPSYVPTNGLVGFWPFNGNANDVSGNNLNGIVHGTTSTIDRFNQISKAYDFNGTSNYINIPHDSRLNFINQYSVSVWFKIPDYSPCPALPNPSGDIDGPRTLISKPFNSGWASGSVELFFYPSYPYDSAITSGSRSIGTLNSNIKPVLNVWTNVVVTYTGSIMNIYINGILKNSIQASGVVAQSQEDLYFGKAFTLVDLNWYRWFKGSLDDIGIWNRALNQQEITKLYQGCNDIIITTEPTNTSVRVGLNAQFTTASANGSSYQWQTNPLNIGWMNLPANSYYTGANTNTLGVNNVSVSNHNQAFRALVNSTGCADTSKIAYLKVADTCLTTVTDTLIIQTTVGLPTPNIANNILIYPNPAKDRITIDNGNYTAMSGYSIKIQNSIGQQVFNSAITQAQFNIDLSTWTGKGIYYVRLLDASGNVVTTRKILLQ